MVVAIRVILERLHLVWESDDSLMKVIGDYVVSYRYHGVWWWQSSLLETRYMVDMMSYEDCCATV